MRNYEAEYMKAADKFVEQKLKVVITLDGLSLLAIIACLQLSLKHPGNVGVPAEIARGTCMKMIDTAAGAVPELGELLIHGFTDPEAALG